MLTLTDEERTKVRKYLKDNMEIEVDVTTYGNSDPPYTRVRVRLFVDNEKISEDESEG